VSASHHWRALGLPGVWLAVSLSLIALSVTTTVGARPLEFEAGAETYYVTPTHLGVTLPGLFVAFAVIYLVLQRGLRTRAAAGLAWVHLALSAIGVSLIYSPVVGFGVFHMSAPSPAVAFRIFSAVSSIGLLMVAVGQIVFVAVLVAAIRSPRSERVVSG
jgi:heme/copper-type cytochrome/quinol oxidase subunit 1